MKEATILRKFTDGNFYRTFYRAIIKLTNTKDTVSTMYYIDFNRVPEYGPEGMSIEIIDYDKENPNKFTHTANWGEDGWTYRGVDDTEEEFEKCLQDFVKHHNAFFVTDKPDHERITEVEEDLDILD